MEADDVKGTIAAAMAVLGMALVLGVALAPSASAGAQRVENAIWADGRLWGTIGTPAVLPGNAPLGSFDKLFMFTNSNNPAGQKPVSEAGPGNPAYNGGRWASFTATWTAGGFGRPGLFRVPADPVSAWPWRGDSVPSPFPPRESPATA